MSRRYEMYAEIRDFHTHDLQKYIDAANTQWNFAEDWLEEETLADLSPKPVLYMHGESYLIGGETEEEFFRRLAHAMRKVGPCSILLKAAYTEPEFEVFTLDANEEPTNDKQET